MSEASPQSMPLFRLNFRNILLLLLVVLIFLFITGTVSPVSLFDTVLLRPILNFLAILSKYLFGSFGLAIVILTIIIRGLTMPLTQSQLRSTRAMQELQPKLKELQKKYAKDKERLNQETMKLYKEQGVNPVGCALPMLIQLPIWIALYQAVIQGVAFAPENLLGLSRQLYSVPLIQETVPLNRHFLWLDLGTGDIFMAILVAVSMWVLQKMSQQPSTDPSQQQMGRIMLWLMPLMFGFFALTFPSGLSLYWVLTNLMSIVIQYRVTGWGSLTIPSLASIRGRLQQPFGLPAGTAATSRGSDEETGADSAADGSKGTAKDDVDSYRKKVRHGKRRDKRKVRRRSH
jgi:YidC/Oxa1 family membrane protein insertase